MEIITELPGKWIKIVCIKYYEFEGTEFQVGDISYHCWGRNIPDNWRKATKEDVEAYISKPSLHF